MRYGLHGKLRAKPGERDKLVAVLLQVATLMKDNQDCMHYIVSTTDDPDIIWVTEIWTSEETHAAALHIEKLRNLFRQALPLIAETIESAVSTPLGGKGL